MATLCQFSQKVTHHIVGMPSRGGRYSNPSSVLLFPSGDKGYTDIRSVASRIGDFASNHVGGFAFKFSAFDEFKYGFIACNFPNPADILTGFDLKDNISSLHLPRTQSQSSLHY